LKLDLTESRIELVFLKSSFFKVTKDNSIKYLITTAVAVILSTSFTLADGCGKHGDKTAMTCELGQEWNAELGMCMDTNA
jgi:hypothetical protein